MTYADVVMWMWVAALVGTLGAFALAWRAIGRADLAVARVRAEVGGVDDVARARSELDEATRSSAGARVRLHTHAAER